MLKNTSLSLLIDDFNKLLDPVEIDGHIIDSFGIIMGKNWKNIFCIPTGINAFIIGEHCDTENKELKFFENLCGFKGKLMMPYYYQHHWCLIVLDFLNETFLHLDPYNKPQSLLNLINKCVFNRFRNFY